MIDGVKLYPLRIIDVPNGDIYHALKSSDEGYCGFGEAYFSQIKTGSIKGWKRHNRFALNIVVPFGAIRFVIFDDRPGSPSYGQFEDITLSPESNYQRLFVEPGLWMAFMGQSEETSILMDIIPCVHDPSEADRRDLNEIPFSF